MKKAILALTTLFVVLFASTACGSGGGLDKDEQKIADNLSAYFQEGSTGALTSKQADCLSDGLVEGAGGPALKKAKLVKANGDVNEENVTFTKKMATTFADSYFDCIDYAKLQSASVAKADNKVDATKLEACITKSIPEDEAKSLIVRQLTKKTDAAAETATFKKLEKCKTESVKK